MSTISQVATAFGIPECLLDADEEQPSYRRLAQKLLATLHHIVGAIPGIPIDRTHILRELSAAEQAMNQLDTLEDHD